MCEKQKYKMWIFEYLLIVIGVLLVLLPTSPMNMPWTYRDSGVFLYTGSRILNGDLPYINIWDHKPPVIFYLNALGLFLGGGSRWGVWFIEFISLLLAAFIGFRLTKKVFGILPSILSLYLWLFSLCFLIQGGNLTTEYTLPLQFACIWLAYQSAKDDFFSWRGFLIGILSGIAFLTKQNTIGIDVAIILFLVLDRSNKGEYKKLLKELLIILFGGLSIFLLIIIYFGYNNLLPEFWNSAFVYNFYYSSSDIKRNISAIISGLQMLSATNLTQFAIVGWSGGLAILFFNKKISNELRSLLTIVLINLPIELLFVSISGKTYPHYFMTLLPIFSFFSSLAFWLLFIGISKIDKTISSQQIDHPKTGIINGPVGKYSQLIIAICVILAFSLLNIKSYLNLVGGYRKHRYTNVLTYIDKSTADNDQVLLWGAETTINFFSDRQSPSRFVYQYPLYTPGYTSKAMIEEFLSDVVQNKPALIINTKNSRTPFMEFDSTSKDIEEGLRYIRSRYSQTETLGSWVFYEFVDKP